MANFKIQTETPFTPKEVSNVARNICTQFNEFSKRSTRFEDSYSGIPVALADFCSLSEEEVKKPHITEAITKFGEEARAGKWVCLFKNKNFTLSMRCLPEVIELDFEISQEVFESNLSLESRHIPKYYNILWTVLNELFDGNEMEISYVSHYLLDAQVGANKVRELKGMSPMPVDVTPTVFHYTLKKGAPFPSDWNVEREK